ncbi:Peptidase A1 domain-containing protein [Madurella fahalii]|uniref:Peptidase A1 domain-containing protein n=1 Tax=Madurella fahalii TaxID=1157608 RepID=A0ABQ0GGQ2_9PEZI
MGDLSIGEVSGLIAAGVFILQVLLALVFPAILIGFVGEENTVVTWSVLGRALQSSLWPTFLQTDAAARHGVRRRVSNGLLLQTTTIVLVSVAAIVTPLGLYQAVEPADGPQLEEFRFVRDDSAFGYGTPPRMAAPFTRNCGDEACPGSSVNKTCVQQGLLERCTDVVYDRSIPDGWRSMLSDGANRVSRSVSNIFDIQWRTQVNASDAAGNLGWYIKSGYRQIGIVVLDPGIHLVEGLIVDAQNGGIGFRNHTVPLPVHEHGSTWSEDILFIEPDSQCVDLNVTFDFHLTQNNTSRLTIRDLALTDRGGFSELPRTSPDLTIPEYGNGQGPLDLRERAYKAAWANNFLTLAYFNATGSDPTNITRWDVTPGMAFRSNSSDAGVDGSRSGFVVEYQAIRSSLHFGEYLELPGSPPRNASASRENPFGISVAHFNLVSEICAGGSHSNPANINSSLVGCGLVYGAARRTDGGSELSPQPGSQWSVPVYSCAASVRATVRTVTFRYNGTGLADLKVTAAERKTYSPANIPLWAVENMNGTRLMDAQPLWGLLGPSNASAAVSSLAANLSTVRQEDLRLPGIVNAHSILEGNDYILSNRGQNLPGVDFHVQALHNAFAIARPGSVGYAGYADYSGMTGLALYTKWKELSVSAEGAAAIIKLVWTDIAANSVVGTKGWGLDDPITTSALPRSRKRAAADDAADDLVPVTVYYRYMRYRLPYVVPAIVVLTLTAIVMVTWVVLLVLGRTGTSRMRWLLDATSSGRILGAFLWPGEAAAVRQSTDEWVKTVGTRVVFVAPESAVAAAQEIKVDHDDSDQFTESNKSRGL